VIAVTFLLPSWCFFYLTSLLGFLRAERCPPFLIDRSPCGDGVSLFPLFFCKASRISDPFFSLKDTVKHKLFFRPAFFFSVFSFPTHFAFFSFSSAGQRWKRFSFSFKGYCERPACFPSTGGLTFSFFQAGHAFSFSPFLRPLLAKRPWFSSSCHQFTGTGGVFVFSLQ